jgi:cyclopropane fatty-acyl-phospholipid synthase-like methyltransferase
MSASDRNTLSTVERGVPAAADRGDKQPRRVQMQLALMRELGLTLQPGSTLLDLGCGNGMLVREYRRLGVVAFGCDFVFKDGPCVSSDSKEGILRLMNMKPYRLPFADESFDVVVSDQVFEHVLNYDETLSEVRRVLKPNGLSVNFFPSRYTPIEPHVYVPFATIIQRRWWLALWATLGIRTAAQKGMAVREVAEANYQYLTSNTNYLSKAAIGRHVSQHFNDYQFCEASFLKVSNRGRSIHQLNRVVPFLAGLYGTLRARVLMFRKS